MTIIRCSMCSAEDNVRHFQLLHRTRNGTGRSTARGAGSIDLCERCWREAVTRTGIKGKRAHRWSVLAVVA